MPGRGMTDFCELHARPETLRPVHTSGKQGPLIMVFRFMHESFGRWWDSLTCQEAERRSFPVLALGSTIGWLPVPQLARFWSRGLPYDQPRRCHPPDLPIVLASDSTS
ncbi:hypothetical protein SCLCIDRAFT_1220420 [Scleroderma citrinum Foug A]|uniref:Uncharacterized protein n=1 Tax=Scleroderma citrinum Foug A TaxID=1036808 RepID=A0A0C3DJX7_9AGAM|nr:hypothetical protein SCLCIDRAFT_1220420 [Scleroderma citrinum Foug A]